MTITVKLPSVVPVVAQRVKKVRRPKKESSYVIARLELGVEKRGVRHGWRLTPASCAGADIPKGTRPPDRFKEGCVSENLCLLGWGIGRISSADGIYIIDPNPSFNNGLLYELCQNQGHLEEIG